MEDTLTFTIVEKLSTNQLNKIKDALKAGKNVVAKYDPDGGPAIDSRMGIQTFQILDIEGNKAKIIWLPPSHRDPYPASEWKKIPKMNLAIMPLDKVLYPKIFEDIGAYDLAYDSFINESTELEEALTLVQRMKRRMQMRKIKAKILRGRKKAMKRKANKQVLMKRAKKAARKILIKKILKGRKYTDLSFSEKEKIETVLAKKKAIILKISKKLYPIIVKKEKERFQNMTSASPENS